MDADTSPPLLASTQTTPVKVTQTSASTTVTIDVYANRPTPGSAGVGSMFYASDQVALWLSSGTSWLRIGPAMAGDIIWTNEVTARAGYILLTGQAWPATTGIYADLYGIWGGTTLPDVQGRALVAKGTHADMATLLGNEGVATVANRRQKHQTTKALSVGIGTLAITSTGTIITDSGGAASSQGGGWGVNGASLTGSPSLSGSIGTNVGTDPVDTGAYIVLQPQAKL